MRKSCLSLAPLACLAILTCALLTNSCSTGGYTPGGTYGPPNMGGPTTAERAAKIASEATGSFYYGRRYYVEKTRFWGYLRKPRQSAKSARLVVFNESRKRNPDRLPEAGPAGQRYGFDQNFEYRIRGYYTGKKVYEVNSNQILPEFMLTGYEMVTRSPGWLFSPKDHYNPQSFTLKPGY
ncbi:MAG: hypothetical protein KJO21_12490 [Verrucomicrobiae bacterium]|nr:hypothetical protein [Verrucomicrobiae bacterium]NNJ43544.1 hypothetical protein [Akkermansiaceae bacterium]